MSHPEGGLNWRWPLAKNVPDPLPYASTHPGGFGAVRRLDVHTGVDLYAAEGDPVFACEAGRVVNVCPFTGPSVHSPWWHETMAVMVEGESGVVLYGEVEPCVEIGADISASQLIGHIKRVLRHDKGRPTSMLHLELYQHGTTRECAWELDHDRPSELRDPTLFLKAAQEHFVEAARSLSENT